MTPKISTGTVHKIPLDLLEALVANPKAITIWEDITPLARNKWICWVISPKQLETRNRRIKVGISKLTSGMKRPCCWAGCIHR